MIDSMKSLARSLAKDAVALVAVLFSLWLVHEDVELNHGIVENGYVETAQVVLCGLSAVLMGLAARRCRVTGRLLALLALLLSSMTFRELDDVFDKLLFHGAWVVFVAPLGLAFAYQAVRHFREVADGATALLATPSGRHLEISFLTLLVYSRIMGSKIIWRHLISQEAFFDIQVLRDIPITEEAFGYLSRAAKNAVEEGLELFAYMLLVLVAMELLCAGRKDR